MNQINFKFLHKLVKLKKYFKRTFRQFYKYYLFI